MPKGQRKADKSRKPAPLPLSSIALPQNICYRQAEAQFLYTDSQLNVYVGEVYDFISKGYSKSWMGTVAITASGFFVSSGLSLLTADFKPFLSFSPTVVRNIVIGITVACFLAMAFFGILAIVHHARTQRNRNRAAVVSWGTRHIKENCQIINTVSQTPLK